MMRLKEAVKLLRLLHCLYWLFCPSIVVLAYDATVSVIDPITCVWDLCGLPILSSCKDYYDEYPPCDEMYGCGYVANHISDYGLEKCETHTAVEQYVSQKHYRLSTAIAINVKYSSTKDQF